jgi:hypothetical protein
VKSLTWVGVRVSVRVRVRVRVGEAYPEKREESSHEVSFGNSRLARAALPFQRAKGCEEFERRVLESLKANPLGLGVTQGVTEGVT